MVNGLETNLTVDGEWVFYLFFRTKDNVVKHNTSTLQSVIFFCLSVSLWVSSSNVMYFTSAISIMNLIYSNDD